MDFGVTVTVAILATVLLPQPGYIHPDEFFQSVEVVAGDVFNISHHRTWEFKESFPIRDITLPYLLFAPGFHALKLLMNVLSAFSLTMPASLLIIVPRLTVTLLGIIHFIFVKILAVESKAKSSTVVWLLLTSYVTWVYFTRTFSNIVETILFSALCVVLSRASDYLESTVERKTKVVDVTNHAGGDTNKSPESFAWRKFSLYCMALGMLVCLGFFNRPTFLVFIFVPLLWWVHYLLSSFRNRFVFAAAVSAVALVATFAVLTVMNTFYYSPDCKNFIALAKTFEDGSVASVAKCLRVPPVNFIQYNMQSENLAEHGLHPWYTHLLVNLGLLLGPLVLVLFWHLLEFVGACWVCYAENKSKVPYREGWLFMFIFVPIILLSCFPHQEPRFLLPVIPAAIVCAAKNSVTRGKVFMAAWLAFNFMAFVFYGWFHQGGLTPALASFSSDLRKLSPDKNRSIHFVFYHTYMPPRYLLLNGHGSVNNITIHDLAGAHPVTFQKKMKEIHDISLKSGSDYVLYLALPDSALPEVSSSVNEWTWLMMNDTNMTQFCPHLSMEKLPEFKQLTSQMCLKAYKFTHFRINDGDSKSNEAETKPAKGNEAETKPNESKKKLANP